MSRWPGRLITKTPVTPGGSAPTASAPGVWTLPEMAYWKKQGLWPDASADAYWGYVSYLMATSSLSNANNNLFVDSSGAFNPVSRAGNTTQGSVTPYGTLWSVYLDGSGDYLSAPTNAAYDISGGDYTIEAWVNFSALPAANNSGNRVAGVGIYSSGFGGGWEVALDLTQNLVSIGQPGSASLTSASYTFAIGQWYHVAVCRASGTNRIFVNGTSLTLTTNTFPNNATGSAQLRIGAGLFSGGYEHYFPGYISNFRLVKGTGLYSSNFTPPASPLTAVSGTSILTAQSNRFKDNSTNNATVAGVGDARVTAFSPFVLNSPGAVYNQSDISYWSGYFDGSGDYLTTPSNAAFAYGTGDFTWEMWVFPTAANWTTTGNYYLMDHGSNGGTLFYYQNVIRYYNPTTGTGSALYTNGGTIPVNQWTHVAVSRSGGTTSLFVNGALRTSASDSYNYGTAAVTLANYGSGGVEFQGYISNARIVKGTAVYTSTFTPPTAPLTAVSGTSLLTCQSAAFTDNSTNNFVITQYGNTTVTGNNPYQSGYYSNYFDGSGDYLQLANNAAFAPLAGDFTLEGWIYPTALTGQYVTPIAFYGLSNVTAVTDLEYAFYITPSNTLQFAIYVGSTAYRATSTATISANTWTHVAGVRSGNTVTLYINGVSAATVSVSGTIIDSTLPVLRIGGYQESGTFYYFSGYISNLRLVKGTAVYTSAFTPSTTPLTAITNTSLLTCQANRLIDSSTNNFTVTKNGDVAVSPFDPFYTATIASNGGSMYFDGSGDYLTLPSSDLYRVDQGNWTMEAWLYPTSTGVNHTVMNRGVYLSTYSFYFGTNGTSVYYEAGTGGWAATPYTSSSGAIIAGQWNHIAVVRSGTSLLMYANGNRVLNQASASFGANVTAPLQIGAYLGGTAVVNGNMTDVRFTQGTALYTGATYTVPTAPLTPSANTTLLLNGMNAGTYDAGMQNNLETVGSAQVASAQAKYGTTSVRFNGNPDYLIMPSGPQFVFGTGDFTVEGWVYVISQSTFIDLYDSRPTSTNGIYPTINISTSGYLSFFVNGADVITGTTSVTTGTWHHFALARSGTSTKLFLNGVQQGSTYTDTNNYLNGTSRPVIASNGYGLGNNGLNGYIDDLRVTKGYARYTANFTPPTQAFPPY